VLSPAGSLYVCGTLGFLSLNKSKILVLPSGDFACIACTACSFCCRVYLLRLLRVWRGLAHEAVSDVCFLAAAAALSSSLSASHFLSANRAQHRTKIYGVCPPVNTNPPSPDDERRSEELLDLLRSYDLYETNEESLQREHVLGSINSLVQVPYCVFVNCSVSDR
jgi:hypothetical protein